MSTRFYSAAEYAEMLCLFDYEWMRGELQRGLDALAIAANVNWIAFVICYPKEETETTPVTKAAIMSAFEHIRHRDNSVNPYGRVICADVLSDVLLLRYNCDGLESAKESEALAQIEHAALYKSIGMLRHDTRKAA